MAAPARAQTAGDINRLNSAVQICNSPMGQGMAECAKLRAQVGGGASGIGGAAGLLGKMGGGKLGGMAGLLGSAMSATQRTQAAPAAAPQGNAAEIQQAVTMCMKSAGSNQTAIQACLAIASGGYAAPAPAPVAYATPAAGGDVSSAIYNNGVEYRACVAANPNNWQACQQALAAKSVPR